MNVRTRVRAGSCYPGYPTTNRYALINGQWVCTCTTDYGCSSGLMGASAAGAPPPPSQ